MKGLLIFVMFLVGCAQEQVIEPGTEKYMELFYKEAAQRDVNPGVYYGGVYTKDLNNMSSCETGEIILDKSTWEKASSSLKEIIFFRTISACLDFNIDESHPINQESFTNIDFYEFNRNGLLDSFFLKTTIHD